MWVRANASISAPERSWAASSAMRARNVLGSGARSRPMSRPTSVGFNRVNPSTLGSPSSAANTSDSTKARAE